MKKIKILFQGDSITDAGRDRSDIHNLGFGYPKYAAELLVKAYPGVSFEFVNLGISGNRTPDLVNRLQSDFIDVKADIVSILIGINDTWHFMGSGKTYSNADYERNYRAVLDAVKKTDAKIIILEQFLLYTPDKASFRADMCDKMEINRALSREFADAYIPLDGLFAEATVDAKSATAFADDGVHPSERGAKFIAEQYLKAVRKILK